jgi:hypothetical protein
MLGKMRSPSELQDDQKQRLRKRMSPWALLLLLPYLGLCFPQFYARATPTLLGFPFFYWYQFAWVVLASAIMGFVYRRLWK